MLDKGIAGAVSNGTRGVLAGGHPVSGNNSNVIDYITIGSNTGNASDFGDLLQVGADTAQVIVQEINMGNAMKKKDDNVTQLSEYKGFQALQKSVGGLATITDEEISDYC